MLSEEPSAYANMTEPERSRNRDTPQSELSKQTGQGDVSPRIDISNRIEFKKSDRMGASPLRFKKRLKEDHLYAMGEGVYKSQTLKVNSKYHRYGKLDKFKDRPQIQTLSQSRHQGKLGSMELQVYQGLESYLPVPKKQNPRSDRKLIGGLRSPQPSCTSSKRSPSLKKFSNTTHFSNYQGGRVNFYQRNEIRRKANYDTSNHSKGSVQRMKMLIFPWEYAELSKRTKENTSLTKEFSQRGNTSIVYPSGSRAPKSKQVSVYKTICPQPSLAQSQFINQ